MIVLVELTDPRLAASHVPDPCIPAEVFESSADVATETFNLSLEVPPKLGRSAKSGSTLVASEVMLSGASTGSYEAGWFEVMMVTALMEQFGWP